MPPLTHTMRHFFASGAVFFRRSRLFFREAAFSSGGEGCEWRAPRATVGESGDKAENEFSGFIPLAVPRKGFSPHIPAPRLFVHFHTTMPTTPPSQKKQHSLLVLPSVTGHSIFAPEFFEMFTKLPSQHPHKVFQVFRVFQVFHFAFGPENRPFLVQIETK